MTNDNMHIFLTGDTHGDFRRIAWKFQAKSKDMKTYRYVLVRFDESTKKLYSYRTNNKKLKARDLVIVPVGKDNHPDVAEIMLVKDFTQNEVPYPLKKTKQVTCKATKIRCFFAALGDALDKAIIEREKQKKSEWNVNDLAWIDQIESTNAFLED